MPFLADGNVRNFWDMQGWYDGSRVIAWAVSISTYQGNSHDLRQKKWCADHASCLYGGAENRKKSRRQ